MTLGGWNTIMGLTFLIKNCNCSPSCCKFSLFGYPFLRDGSPFLMLSFKKRTKFPVFIRVGGSSLGASEVGKGQRTDGRL